MPVSRNTKEAFVKHCEENPEIYELFKRFAFEAMKHVSCYSAGGILHRIRWETTVSESGCQFKIDHNWASHYARKFMSDYPEHSNFFRVAKRKNSFFNEETV
jgi:hypothetical protein|tara:strand:- start:2658 stop:2963 length:306 start_codon:yes stop_codon:yes gene_type:complete